MTTLVTAVPRHTRLYCVRKNSSGRRARASELISLYSLDEAPAGEVQEDVLERAAPDENALGDEPAFVDPV